MTLPYDHQELEALAELADELLHAGCSDDARAVWAGLAAMAPAEPAPLVALAAIALAERRSSDAAVLASAAIERGAAMPMLLLRAEALLDVGRYAEAAADLDRLAALVPRSDDERTVSVRAALLRERLARPGMGYTLRP